MSDYNDHLYIIKGDSTIDGGTEGTAVDIRGFALGGIIVPASMAGTTITFKASVDGTNFYPLKDDQNNDVSVTIDNSAAFHNMRAVLALGALQVKPVSSATETSKAITIIGIKVA